MKNLPRIKVTAGILCRGDKVLLAQRPEEKYQGLWEFPGGKIEEGETPEQCLHRELKEELSIDCQVGDLFKVTEWEREDKVIVLHTYWISSFDREPQAIEHKELKWISKDELVEEDLLPADRALVSLLKSL